MNASIPAVMPDFCNRRFPFHYSTALMTLMKMEVDISRVNILAAGKHENYRGEIWEQDPKPGTPLDSDTPITLKAGFSSAVDHMPYQFFYGLEGVRESTGEWDIQARKLMAAFDAAVIRRMAIADAHQMKYSLGLIDLEHLTRFLALFDFDVAGNADDLREVMVWAALFPSFHFWAGNPELVAHIIGIIFGHRCRIEENVKARYDIPESIRYRLGNNELLGKGTLLGGSFVERDSRYRVIIEDVDPDRVIYFLPEGAGRRKLRKILEFCMPGHLEYDIKIKPKARGFRLGRESGRGYLGYTTHAMKSQRQAHKANLI